MESEIWLPIMGWEGFYEISSTGLVKTLSNIAYGGHRKSQKIEVKEKTRAFHNLINGYAYVKLTRRPRSESFAVHRLVAQAFIPNPENKPQINHKDGNKLNNNVSNLEWCTRKENTKHAFDTGLRNNKRPKRSPLETQAVIDIFNSPLSLDKLANKYNIPKLTVQSIKSGKRRSGITGKQYLGKKS